MAKTMIISVKTGTYTNRNNEEKNSYATVGRLFVKDDGSMFGKLDSLPISKDWDWMFNVFEPTNKNENSGNTQKNDDLPF